jgi:hypothetical protein
MEFQYFIEIIKRLDNLYGTRSEEEHRFIYEFYDGPIPLFKLILNQLEGEKSGSLIASFHIELDATSAIQWFLRIRQLDPNLHITGSYLKDRNGTSYVGEDAAILRAYMVEQDIITAWLKSDKNASEVFEEPIQEIKPSPIKVFTDYKLAITKFQQMQKKKGDISH